MIKYIESKHKCTTQCFVDIYAAIPANEYSMYAAYMLHVAPTERRPEAVVLPDALEPVLRQMSLGSEPRLKMNLDLIFQGRKIGAKLGKVGSIASEATVPPANATI
jgi:hypothetical protein